MGLLIFLGVLAGIAIVFTLAYQLMAVRRTEPEIPMVRIAIAATSLEADMWAQRLRATGSRCRIEDFTGSAAAGTYYPNAYNAELWVRLKDERTARELLGL